MKLMSTIIYRKSANNITERSGYTQYAKNGRLPPLYLLRFSPSTPKLQYA